MKIVPILIALIIVASGRAEASFLDDQSELNSAISQLRSAIGKQPRVYKMWIGPGEVTVDAQDPNNFQHLSRWHFAHVLGFIPWVFGPEHVDDRYHDPNLEAMLYDLDKVAFSELPKLGKSALKRAAIGDGAVKLIAIVRAQILAGTPTAGDIVVSLHIEGAHEHADVNATAQGVIVGGDFSETQHAQTLNLFKEPDLIADAAAAFRDLVDKGPILTQIKVDARSITFETNISTEELKRQIPGATFSLEWDLNGFVQRINPGAIQRLGRTQTMQTPEKATFSIDDVDWTMVAKLETDALAKVDLPQTQVTRLALAKSSGGGQNVPGVAWTVDVTDAASSVNTVTADAKGVIVGVIPSAQPQAHR